MNPRELLSQAAEAFENRIRGTTKSFMLVWMDGQVKCVPTDCSRVPEIIFGRWSDYQISKGFTAGQWFDLQNKLLAFWEHKKW